MSIEENKRLALRVFVLLYKPAIAEAFAMMSPDAVCWIPTDQPGGATMSAGEMRQGAVACFNAFSEKPHTRTSLIAAEADRVCVELVSRGGRTHRGATYDNDYCIWLRFREGLIVEYREYGNPLLLAPLMAELKGTV